MEPTFVTPKALAQREIRIVFAGAGATGSWLLQHLVRIDRTLLHLGHPEGLHVEVWDGDTVSEANIGRGSFVPAHVGQNKALCLVHQTNQVWGTSWTAKPMHLAVDRLERILPKVDLLVSATDSAAWRRNVGKAFANTPTHALWCDAGNSRHTGQVILGHLGKPSRSMAELRLPNVYDLYGKEIEEAVSVDTGPSCSVEEAIRRQDLTINIEMAAKASQLLWNLLRHGGLDAHGVYTDTQSVRCAPLPISREAWEWMGYQTETA